MYAILETVPGRRRAADLGTRCPSVPPSSATRQPALHQLLAGRLRHPEHRRYQQAAAYFGARLDAPLSHCPTHTALPLPFEIRGRRYLVVADDDAYRPLDGMPAFMWMLDIADERAPVPVGSYQVEGLEDGPQPLSTACHQPCEIVTGTEIPTAWFACGLRVIDIVIPSKDTATVVATLAKHVRKLPQELRRSLIWDRGKGPWQRGSNENTNGLLRQYFPKGTDLSRFSQAYLNKIALQLNQRPRETLGCETPADRLRAVLQ